MSNDLYDTDPELALALQLSKDEYEKEEQFRNSSMGNSASGTLRQKITGKGSSHHLTGSAEVLGEFLRQGCKTLWETKLYTDIILVVGEQKIPAHRIVICSWSETFKAMLENDVWRESHQQELPVSPEDPDLFKLLLQFMYTGQVEINSDQVIPLLAMSNYYGVYALKDYCGDLISKTIDIDNVFSLIEIAKQYSCGQLETECAAFLAENFGEMLKQDKLMQLDVDTWAKMLKSDDIQVTSEEDVFDAVVRYADQYDKTKRIETLEKVLPCVRFPLLSSEFLVDHVEENPKLTGVKILHTLLHETYRYKAFPGALPSDSSIVVSIRKGVFLFDSDNKNHTIEVSNDKMIATNSSSAVNGSWVNVRCGPSFPEAISYRAFKVKFSQYFMIGVQTKQFDSKTNTYPGTTVHGWSWYNTGQLYHGNATTNLNNNGSYLGYATGDTIGMLVDGNSGKLVFYKNGKPTKATITLSSKEVFPVVTFYGPGDSATIMTSMRMPPKMPKGWNVGQNVRQQKDKKKNKN